MEKLPSGLVSTSGKVPTELDSIDVVDVGDIVQLWRAYSANPSAHEGDMGYRLQNFFWRIWGNEHLRNSMPGWRLATLFLRISEPGSFTSGCLNKKPTVSPRSNLKPDKSTSERQSNGSSGKAPLPPILKKSNTSGSHGDTQKTTRLLLTDPGGQSVTRKPSNPPTPIPPSRPVLGADLGNRQGQKKTFVVASKAKGAKRRPVVMRRKSSQQSSVGSSTQCSTRAQSPQPTPSPLIIQGTPAGQKITGATKEVTKDPKATDIKQDPDDQPAELPTKFLSNLKGLLTKTTPPAPSSAKSPPPSLGFFSPMAGRHFDVRHLSTENYEQPSTSSLVDKNFRTRFAERKSHEEQHQGSSSSSSSLRKEVLSGPGPFSTESPISTNDTVSPSRFGGSQEEVSTVGTSIPISNGPSTTATNATFSSSSNANSSSNAGGMLFLQSPGSLPRGPGQLSLLIEQSRSHGGSPGEIPNH